MRNYCTARRTVCLLASLLAIATTSQAQVAYDQIEVGTTLTASGIALGLFSKPIPLPEGNWAVVNRSVVELPLTGGRSDSPSSTPRVSLTLRRLDRGDSPLFAMVVHFTPNSIPINWGNHPCTTDDPLGLVDNFNVNANAMLYACARSNALYNLRQIVKDAPTGPDNWFKAYLSGLAPHADELPNSAVAVDINSNKFRGKAMNITFLLRADANADVNPAYRQHLQTWMHDTGLRWMKVVNNDATDLPGPATYWASK